MFPSSQDRRWVSILAWLLAGFFVVGAVGNLMAPTPIAEDYRRWGYPDGFHFITGTLELVAAILLALRRFRLAGVGLAAALMGAAVLTVLIHREYGHAIAPGIVLVVTALVGLGSARGVSQVLALLGRKGPKGGNDR